MGEHWYTREGLPCYEVPKAGGVGFRATTIADARKLRLRPSVTTVLSVIDKPALTNWKIDQAILAALTLPRIDGEAERDYLARVKADGAQQAKDAADEGTRIHDALEAHFKRRPFDAKYEPHVAAVVRRLEELYPGVNDWVAEAYIPEGVPYGGKCDIHSPSTGLTCDYKGKDGDFSDGKKLAYDQHWQLAPYQRGLCVPKADGFNIFVSRTHPGKVAHHVWTPADMTEGWAVFQAALALWQAIRKYNPGES